MKLLEIQQRLVAHLRARVQNGELTERGFARSIGISQGHIHNVLKGIRTLSLEKSDLILEKINCSLLDFVSTPEINEHLARLSTRLLPSLDWPFLIGRLGPGLPWPTQLNPQDRHPVPCSVLDGGHDLRLMRLAEDRSMDYTARGQNIAVLDVADPKMSSDAIYAINRGDDTVLRRARLGKDKLYLAADADLDHPSRWHAVALPFPRDLVRGQVRWLGVERALKAARSK